MAGKCPLNVSPSDDTVSQDSGSRRLSTREKVVANGVMLGPHMKRYAPSSSIECTVVSEGNGNKQNNPTEPLFKKHKPKIFK